VSGTAPCQGRLDVVHTASQRLDRSTQGYLAGLTQLEMSLRCLHCLLAAFNIWFFNVESPKALGVQLELAGYCTGKTEPGTRIWLAGVWWKHSWVVIINRMQGSVPPLRSQLDPNDWKRHPVLVFCRNT
jgi:hypothetical protein